MTRSSPEPASHKGQPFSLKPCMCENDTQDQWREQHGMFSLRFYSVSDALTHIPSSSITLQQTPDMLKYRLSY
ncbi:MAG TPA: hypothetical protein VHL11_20695 [Phototrophicaceae bacterium]|nr:hypothetical protein [Phototrophicaceae bacterium]